MFKLNLKSKLLGEYVQNFNDPYRKKGLGFAYNGIEYIHHSTLPIQESVFHRLTHKQKIILTLFLISLTGFIIFRFNFFFIYLTTILSVFYLIDILFNALIIGKGATSKSEVKVSVDEVSKLKDKDLPSYTILCPLYKESGVISQFINAMGKMNYPKNKLQIIIILERDDKETIKAVKNAFLPKNFKVVIMPDSLPKTKPKALNFGMKYATGEYVVIYDAEDIPDPDQLKKAVIAFRKTNDKTVCVQAKLNFYNPEQNILTRLFTGEYSLLYGFILPGLQSIHAPIPLGGTSNHFDTKILKSLNYWDSFNVTEDCDLGIRLFKKGYLTAIVDSTTYEEANSEVKNWFHQRIRWQKGYILSYIVHLRKPSEFVKNNYKIHFLTFQFIIGGKMFTLLLNPIMWTFLITYFIFNTIFNYQITGLYLNQIAIITKFTLFFGYTFYTLYYIFALYKTGKKKLIPFTIFVPVYWTMMSIASYFALYEAYKRPHAWSKTVHGLHLKYKAEEPIPSLAQGVSI